MLIEYIQYILNGIGLSDILLTLQEIVSYVSELSSWAQLIRPDVLFSVIFYLGAGIGIWQIVIVYPFRLLKKFIRFPSRKACEK